MPPVVPQIRWPGSGSSPLGLTPLGKYDDDDVFIEEAPKVADQICKSLGYPIVDIELTDSMIYAQFENGITEYNSIVNEFNIRENMLALQGMPTSVNASQRFVKSSPLAPIIEMSQQYATEVGLGGNVDFKKNAFVLTASIQDYDLQVMLGDQYEGGKRIQIRRVFHETPPAISRIFDPFAQAGLGLTNVMSEFGWGGMSVPTQFLLTPVFENLLRIQAIEFNDIVRRSNYSFEIKNNKIRVFPIPDGGMDRTKMWVEYTVKDDVFSANNMLGSGSVSDFSNAPYSDMQYSVINDVGKQWIRKFTLAMCKIVLGNNRSKYDSIPIPNDKIQLDGLTLRQEGERERDRLYDQLRESLEEAGKTKQLEKASQNADNSQNILRYVPTLIFVG